MLVRSSVSVAHIHEADVSRSTGYGNAAVAAEPCVIGEPRAAEDAIGIHGCIHPSLIWNFIMARFRRDSGAPRGTKSVDWSTDFKGAGSASEIDVIGSPKIGVTVVNDPVTIRLSAGRNVPPNRDL